jgi:hypothetical protein
MTKTIGEILEQFVQKSKLSSGLRSCQIESVWENMMGKTIAKYTDKVFILNNTLFIETSVASLRNELHFQRAEIMKMVNSELGERLISEVVIR